MWSLQERSRLYSRFDKSESVSLPFSVLSALKVVNYVIKVMMYGREVMQGID